MDAAEPLPFRTNGDDLYRLIDGLARGRTPELVREDGFRGKGFEGTTLGAAALGLVDPASATLTIAGREYGLADAVRRPALLAAALARHAPYAAVIAAVRAGEVPEEMEADWLARWWAVRGFGSSESNRAEGVAAFARLAEAAGLVLYVPGRRGHPTRLRWTRAVALPAAGAPIDERAAAAAAAPSFAMPAAPAAPAAATRPAVRLTRPPSDAEVAERTDGPERSEVVFALGPARVARLQLPAALTPSEKQRLLTLIDVLVRTEPG